MIRDDVTALPAYAPGRQAPGVLKLSSNEVAQGPLPSVVDAMADACGTVNRYPDMFTVELKAALADSLGLSSDQVAVGCGSSALCQQLVQISCMPGDEVVFAWRSFEAYPIFTKIVGAKPVMVPLTDDYRHDLPAMAEAITESTRLVFVCNPNNPTGTMITAAEFEAFMAAVPDSVIVALDEAYVEYVRVDDTPQGLEAITRWPNVVVLRTFSKAYGLAGARVGYAFGNPEIIGAMNKVAIPFAVNTVAQAAAIASLGAKDELLERTEETVQQRRRVSSAIDCAVDSQANFVWIDCPAPLDIAARLIEAGVMVRAFAEGIRVTITTEEETDRFLAAWDSVVGQSDS